MELNALADDFSHDRIETSGLNPVFGPLLQVKVLGVAEDGRDLHLLEEVFQSRVSPFVLVEIGLKAKAEGLFSH